MKLTKVRQNHILFLIKIVCRARIREDVIILDQSLSGAGVIINALKSSLPLENFLPTLKIG